MIDPLPPTLDLWVFAGAGGGALLTYLALRAGRKNAYQHGYDHGRGDADHELARRLGELEHQYAQQQAALARAHAECAELRQRLAGQADADGTSGLPPPAG